MVLNTSHLIFDKWLCFCRPDVIFSIFGDWKHASLYGDGAINVILLENEPGSICCPLFVLGILPLFMYLMCGFLKICYRASALVTLFNFFLLGGDGGVYYACTVAVSIS